MTGRACRWNLDVRPRAQRQLARLPEKIATAAAGMSTVRPEPVPLPEAVIPCVHRSAGLANGPRYRAPSRFRTPVPSRPAGRGHPLPDQSFPFARPTRPARSWPSCGPPSRSDPRRRRRRRRAPRRIGPMEALTAGTSGWALSCPGVRCTRVTPAGQGLGASDTLRAQARVVTGATGRLRHDSDTSRTLHRPRRLINSMDASEMPGDINHDRRRSWVPRGQRPWPWAPPSSV